MGGTTMSFVELEIVEIWLWTLERASESCWLESENSSVVAELVRTMDVKGSIPRSLAGLGSPQQPHSLARTASMILGFRMKIRNTMKPCKGWLIINLFFHDISKDIPIIQLKKVFILIPYNHIVSEIMKHALTLHQCIITKSTTIK